GLPKQKLVREFVEKCYIQSASAAENKDWKKSVAGYEWLTEQEMREEKKWPEQGSEKLRALEEVMESSGFFRENFDIHTGIGDAVDLSDHEDDDNKKSTAKGRDKGLPDIDGPDTLKEFLNKYKKSLLNRRSAFKEVVERLKTEGATDHTEDHKEAEEAMKWVNDLYKQICNKELDDASSQTKESYAGLAKQVRDALVRFNNCLSALKPPGAASQYIIPIRDLAAEILEKFPQKLLFGNCEGDSPQVGDTLKQFWRFFRAIRPGHPVFQDHADELHRVIPCRLHMDEGTSHRKHAVMQVSWGPILKDGAASVNHCFYFASILGDSYKEDHCGYAAGNSIIDVISRHLAIHCKQAYYTGMELGSERFYLAWIGLEGDLPAQARVLHLVRHFTCAPNKCCPWCQADDRDTPYADFRPTARWKRTVGVQQPWTTPSPLLSIPGADTAEFALTDIFHLCHLGIVRTGVTSLICYLCYKGFFDQGGLNVPAKGSDCTLLVKFLLDYLGQPWLLDDVAASAFQWLAAIDDFLHLCYTTDRIFFTPEQSQTAHGHLCTFAEKYHDCASKCFARNILFFNLTPKYHYMLHVRDSLELRPKQKLYMNPAATSTQMDEDYVGRVSQSSRTVHALGVPLRVGQKWLVYTHMRWSGQF
ncbi:unnamed protein product, partial [Symbiodinium necroappetens]